jgi:predicted unusual protein kinase regulating ubiquinone biosynthesis (AarF/ABC1/UbiB family)
MLVRMKANGEPSLVILDTGIVYQSKSEAEHKRLIDICLAFMKHDGRLAGRLMIDNANPNLSPETRVHNQEFCEAIQGLVTASESESYFEHLAEYFMKVCDLAREYNVRLDPGYFKIVMALKVAEGMSLALNRNLDLVSTCVPIIAKAQAMQALGIQKFPLPEDDIQHLKPIKEAKK